MVEPITGFVSTLKFTLEVPANAVTELGMDATAVAPLMTARLIMVFCASICENVSVPVVLFPP